MKRALAAAVGVYLALAVALILQRPGLQYEEACFQHGAVHMLTTPHQPPRFAHHPGSWVEVAGRQWPLMIVPYVGAVGHYLFLLPFALLGPGPTVGRVVTALLGALGLWGLGRLIGEQADKRAGVAAALAAGVNASYLAYTVFNKASVAFWMGSLGLLCLAANRYLSRRTALAAFAVGLAAGLGCWSFLMFGWLLAAAALPAALAARRHGLPARHLGAALAGGALALAPFFLSLLLSRAEVMRAASAFSHDRPLLGLLRRRLRWLGELLLSDPEMRIMLWGGPDRLPWWQSGAAGGLLLAAMVVALLRLGGGRAMVWHRAVALTLAALSAPMLLADWALAARHLVLLVPLAAAVLALAAVRAWDAWRRARPALALLAALYLGGCLWWDVRMARGLRDTGGLDAWSDSLDLVAGYLRAAPPAGEVVILDWGFLNGLIVLSNNSLPARELFWGATHELSGDGRPWAEEIAAGRRYLLNSGGNRHFRAPDEGFRAALAASGRPYRRVVFRQRTGAPFAELVEVEPLPAAALPAALAADPRVSVARP